MPAELSYTTNAFWSERQAIIDANMGRIPISMIALLPNAPGGPPWADVSATLAALPSPVRFLAYLFVDTACPSPLRPTSQPEIWIDGILGSASCAIDPWTILPAVGIWARSPRMVDAAARHLTAALEHWHDGHLPPQCQRSRIAAPDAVLRGFVPYGRVPNRRMVDMFLARAAAILGCEEYVSQ